MRLLAGAALVAIVAQTPGASTPRFARPIVVAAPGPQRVAIDAALVANGAPFSVVTRGDRRQRRVAEGGLSDLRLTAADGREVPYLLVYAPAPEPQWVRAAVLSIPSTSKTSGFEADLGSVRDVDRLDLVRSPGPLMKRFSLEASADREHWTLVVPESTMFDVPERQLRHLQASFQAGAYRYLRVTWDDTNSARVPAPPDVMVRLAGAGAAPPPTLTLPLGIERRPSEPGRSRYHLTLPARRLPIVALRLEVGGSYVFRDVTVTEPRLAAWQAAPATIGEGLLFRDGGPDSRLEVPIQPPSQSGIDLVVQDGNNPPLELHGVAAVFAEMPWIYVDAPGPLVAHYGDFSLPRPTYDLEAARGTVRIDAVPEAHWGEPSVVQPAAAPAPPVDAAALGGGPIDVSPFHYSRAVTVGDGPLQALPLDAAVLAHSAGPAREFADVRIVDAAGRQVPRLIERRPEPLLIALRAEPASAAALELQPTAGVHRSIYHVDLPYPSLPDASIVLTTSAPVFQRHITVGYERPPDRGHRDPWFLVTQSVEWARGEGAPDTLTLTVPPTVADAAQLTLVVDEGDNSALPITGVQLILPSYRLRFARPASASRLVYGSPAMDAPRYDLALLAPSVLQAEATEVSMAAEAPTAAAAQQQLISPKMFWVILAVAVIALLGVLAALLRKPV